MSPKEKILNRFFVVLTLASLLAGCAFPPPKAENRDSYTVTFGVNEKSVSTSKDANWEILATDGTLRKTLERWAQVANWEIVWTDLPEFKNPGYVKLENRDFLSVCDYVSSKAKIAAREAGFEIFITAHPNRVLVISKEAPQ